MPDLFTPRAPQPLGRTEPLNFRHVDRFPLTASTTPPKPVPGVWGIDWCSEFDRPIWRNGRWWLPDVSKGENLGPIRGGHGICGKPQSLSDLTAWWIYYDQNPFGGACVGFSGSRMKTLLERARFDGAWLYWTTQKQDYWSGGAYPGYEKDGPYYEGTSVSTMFDVLRTIGHKTPKGANPNPNFGVTTNRWAQSIDEVRASLQSPLQDNLEAFQLLNSWGQGGYPHVVHLPYPTAHELLVNRGGEYGIPTDR